MATTGTPYVEQNGSYSAVSFRRLVAGLLGRSQPATLTATVGGVVNPTDLKVSAHGTANMSVTVAGGYAFIPQTQAANAGMYGALATSTSNLAVAAANASNPRVDLVCATIQDKAYAGSTTTFVVQVVTGTPTSGATLTNKSGAPSLPAASIPLAYVLVPANATSITTADIADVRSNVSRPGPVIGATNGPPTSGSWPARATYLDAGNVLYVCIASGTPGTWTALGVPAARQYQTAAQTVTYNSAVLATSMATDFLRGGFTASASGLTVPITGLYQVSAQSNWNIGTSGTNQYLSTLVYVGATQARGSIVFSADYASPAVSDLILLTAGQVVSLRLKQGNTSSKTKRTAGNTTWISLSFVSP